MPRDDYTDDLEQLAEQTTYETERLEAVLWRQLSMGLLLHVDAEADEVMGGILEDLNDAVTEADESEAMTAFVETLGEAIGDVGVDLAYGADETERTRVHSRYNPDGPAPVGGVSRDLGDDEGDSRTNSLQETHEGEDAPVGGVTNHPKTGEDR